MVDGRRTGEGGTRGEERAYSSFLAVTSDLMNSRLLGVASTSISKCARKPRREEERDETHAFLASSAGLTPCLASRSLPPFSMTQWHRLCAHTQVKSRGQCERTVRRRGTS